ncbi:PREDICTED: testis-expressed sequence 2 protein [Cyphomyrmex costatus]|uniref:Testis-expressed sequence 2 protein n=1 Tax=Cyphomyrmex costatus TaxID=456900 RepID=A0A195CCS1_9HYME|nr:PREDICTED: testis-expressed sequence 2 protein [Cyphomyrmex costatus]KYM97883.1 Testis-expressed sequence 2 protein [Cyphomyrmex costatus]
MGSKYSPGKITLGMIKGKPITTSVPVIHYRANDDELEELYPSSSDDEKRLTPEFDKKIPSSPSKSSVNGQGLENDAEKRSIEDNALEGTSRSSDPWKVLSEIKGKITKTFEEKISEMKSDRKKRKRNKDNSSVSDSEETLGDITPTDENINDKQEKELARNKGNTSRFVGFSQVRTGLKTRNSQDDSVESGVEAAEFSDLVPEPLPFESQDDFHVEDKENDITCNFFNQSDGYVQTKEVKFSTFLFHIKDYVFQQLTKQLAALLVLMLAFCYLIPLPAHLIGFSMGVFVTIVMYKLVQRIKEILQTPLNKESAHVVLEIPAAEEHAVQERYEGWLNELPYTYDPHNYHVARTKSVFFSLEGGMLRVSETRMKVPKRAVWDEPKRKYKFTRKREYNLNGAKIELLPEGLTRTRRWSKKYPICITMDQGALVNSTSLNDWTDLGKETLEDEKKIVQAEGVSQEVNESTFGEETKSEDEDSRLEYFKDNEEDEFKIDDDEDDDDFSQSKSIRSIYEDCRDNEETSKCKLYVFARADREKEDWFRRLVSAASFSKKRHSICSINDSVSSVNTISAQLDMAETKSLETSPEVTYSTYMNKYLNVDPEGSPRESDVLWANCLLGRILFDMHSCPEAINLIQDRIQRKLSNIKLPYFMESLHVTEIVIGQDAPIIHNVSKPALDERGLWFDLNITYKGSITMTVETKLNLMKLTRASSVPSDIVDEKSVPTRSPIFDSDVEDSPETSTEDEDIGSIASSVASKETTPVQSSGKKFLSMVDKLTANKYFRHATELSYIRRAMEGVSNTEIRFMVNVSGIEGCLLLNIPPPPSDRLWYGFKSKPKIALTVQPTLGERTVNIVYVSNWIENKLLREFEKLVVLPNMDDLVLPLCPNYPFTTT